MESSNCSVAFHTHWSKAIQSGSKKTCFQSWWCCLYFKFKSVSKACYSGIHFSTASINVLCCHQRICWLKIKCCCCTTIANQMGWYIKCFYAKDSKWYCKGGTWRVVNSFCPNPSWWEAFAPVFFLMCKALISSQQLSRLFIDPVIVNELRAQTVNKPMKRKEG